MEDNKKQSVSRCMYKILILGNCSVGKSSILNRYVNNSFSEFQLSTIGLDVINKNLTLDNGKEVTLQIWDTAGSERYQSMTRNYFRGADGILLIFDITNFVSYNNIEKWIEQIKETTNDGIPMYLIGNKIDLEEERIVGENELQYLVKNYSLKYKEVSAKSGVNIKETFFELAKEIDEFHEKNKNNNYSNLNELKPNMFKKKKKKDCC